MEYFCFIIMMQFLFLFQWTACLALASLLPHHFWLQGVVAWLVGVINNINTGGSRVVQWTTPLQACLRHPNSTQSTPKSTTMRHRHSRTTIRTQAVHQTRTKQTICLDRPHLRQITGKISTHILRSAWNIKGMGILNYPFSYRENNVCCSDPDSTAPGGGEHASPWKYHQSFQVL